MRRQTVDLSAVRAGVEGVTTEGPRGPCLARAGWGRCVSGHGGRPPAMGPDPRNDSSAAPPPYQKLVFCFSYVFSISLLKLNVFLN